ncbi:MAG: PIN/TRAM domain-containing protein [Eubacterium aggregans]|nr:PIN/TRAM domain-containing protein [Eubacterium aggregans]MDD4692296.1 PIN/TRAM domain-containing protein [Eubacterium aggregans]MEA5072796.1 PIN/TRAM domain-containing protein [Eubacterium aggregans]
MLKKVIRWFVTLLGFIAGLATANILVNSSLLTDMLGIGMTQKIELGLYIFLILLFGIIFYFLFPLILSGVQRLSTLVEKSMEDVRLADVALGCLGLIIGLVIAMLISFAFSQIPIPWVSSLLSAIIYIALGYIGFTIPIKKRDEILNAIQSGKRDREGMASNKKMSKKKVQTGLKILDTSVIIDGRIYDICKTGFLEGTLIVPVFVLNELQLIADSGDDLKRTRGRRGLDIIKKMQTDLDGIIAISEEDYEDLSEVDAKLVRMAKEKKQKIVTNDYNLNKVASVQGIEVLNINELAGAVKPVVLPGEEMKVLPVKNGKENGQAVAYLDDGTMIVVENGRRYIGENITVMVTSILQTAAGRMIFAKPRR